MNTHDVSQACGSAWTPIVASTAGSIGGRHECCSECSSQLTTSEVEFVHLVLDQHRVDMAKLADEFTCFVGQFLHIEQVDAVSAA